MEISIKLGCSDSHEFVDLEPHVFRKDQETEVVVAKEFDMKIQSVSSQARLKCEPNRILHQTEEETPKGHQKEKRTSGRTKGVMYRRLETMTTDLILELQPMVEV